MQSSPNRSKFRALAFAVSALLALIPVVLFGPLYVIGTVPVGEVAFEPGESRDDVFVRYGSETSAAMYPISVREVEDAVVVFPGRTVVVPLTDVHETVSWRHREETAPWIVVGREGVDERPVTNTDGGWFGHTLHDEHTLAIVDGDLAFVRWNATASWADDSRRLGEIAATCGDPQVRVERVGNMLKAEVGACAATLPGLSSEERWRLALAGATDGASVARDGGWGASKRVAWGAPLFLAFLAAVRFLAFGPRWDGSLNLVALIVWLVFPAWGAMIWLGGAGFCAPLLLVRAVLGWRRTATSERRWAMIRGAVAIVLFLGMSSSLRTEDDSTPHLPSSGVPAACMLTGYSAASSSTLPDEAFGMYNQLDIACGGCAPGTARWTSEGRSFGWVGQRLCSDELPESTEHIFFYGGANDATEQPYSRLSAIRSTLFALMSGLANPEELNTLAALDEFSGRHLARFETEAEQLELGLSCLAERGVQFHYFHDFLVTDMERGRGPNRLQLASRRQAVVEATGGEFVDTFVALGPTAGITWFNDFIHPSAVGHLELAALMCEVAATSHAPADTR